MLINIKSTYYKQIILNELWKNPQSVDNFVDNC